MSETITYQGGAYTLLETLPVLGGDGQAVLCADASGSRFVMPQEEWLRAEREAALLPAVHGKSTAEEKITLFLSLFRGREDVYAKRYYSQKSGSAGYTPACRNEWEPGLCDKRKNKCAECPNRSFLPLSPEVVRRHLIGHDAYCRDVAGIYPLLPDDTTWLLCMDFDDEAWQADASAVRSTAEGIGLTPAVERSRSGNGAHIWFFFEEPVSASSARKLGSGLLTRAMENRHELSFESYDRLFPSQDTLPRGGFGNLIALPFQGQAQKQGNTLFVDEDFHPYPDQWAYLSGLPKITPAELDTHLAVLCRQSDTGQLAEEKPVPWEVKRDRKDNLTAADFPDAVTIVRSNLLWLRKAGISQAALNRIKRFAAFRNPDFYKAQAMRLPVYDKPRIIHREEDTPEYLGIPRGCMDELRGLLAGSNVKCHIEEKRNPGKTIAVSFRGTPRPEQEPAAAALLEHDTGVLSATTAFGKTVVGAYLIGMKKVNTLILVPSSALLAQWKTALEQFLNIEEVLPEQPKKRVRKKNTSVIGLLGNGKHTVGGIVDVAIIQSLFENREKDVKPFVADYGMVICDECHHVAAFSFEKVLRAVNPTFVYGLSATPTRPDGHQPIIFMQCGPIRYLVDAKTQAEKRSFHHAVVPRLTKLRLPESDIQSVYAELCRSEFRNAQIAADAAAALAEGRSPILLTERKEHAEQLYHLLQGAAANVFLLLGCDSQKEKREKLAALKAVPPEESLLIVATGRYVGEGFDEPRLDTLLLAMPIAWKGTLAQYAGRLHRSYEGKQEVRILDYVDIHVPVLERMYRKRLRGYAELGYQVISGDASADAGVIYTAENYLPVFRDDLRAAGRSAVFCAPALSPKSARFLTELLPMSLPREKIRVITRPTEEAAPKRQAMLSAAVQKLKESGIRVDTVSGMSLCCALIDESLVWYGGINYLTGAKPEDTALRLENPTLAGELLELFAGEEHAERYAAQ